MEPPPPAVPPDVVPPPAPEAPSSPPPTRTAAPDPPPAEQAAAVEGFEHAENAGSVEAINRLKQQSMVKVLPNGDRVPLPTVDNIDVMPRGREVVVVIDNHTGQVADIRFGEKWTPQQKANFRRNFKP
jgi:hypothetical protein